MTDFDTCSDDVHASDVLHDALKALEARCVSPDTLFDDSEVNLLHSLLTQRGFDQVIERGIWAGGVNPSDDGFADLVQVVWGKILMKLHGSSLRELRDRYPNPQQFVRTFWRAAENTARDRLRSERRRSRREVSLDRGWETEERSLPESYLRINAGNGGLGTDGTELEQDLEIRIDRDLLRGMLKDYLVRNASPQQRKKLPRLLALVDYDWDCVARDGHLPPTDEIMQVLDFPSRSTVSQARRLYRDRARKLFGSYGAR